MATPPADHRRVEGAGDEAGDLLVPLGHVIKHLGGSAPNPRRVLAKPLTKRRSGLSMLIHGEGNPNSELTVPTLNDFSYHRAEAQRRDLPEGLSKFRTVLTIISLRFKPKWRERTGVSASGFDSCRESRLCLCGSAQIIAPLEAIKCGSCRNNASRGPGRTPGLFVEIVGITFVVPPQSATHAKFPSKDRFRANERVIALHSTAPGSSD